MCPQERTSEGKGSMARKLMGRRLILRRRTYIRREMPSNRDRSSRTGKESKFSLDCLEGPFSHSDLPVRGYC